MVNSFSGPKTIFKERNFINDICNRVFREDMILHVSEGMEQRKEYSINLMAAKLLDIKVHKTKLKNWIG